MELDELKQFHRAFFDEARDHVRTLEERLLELESRPGDAELLNALFRAAHSIKGASGMLGFEAVSRLTHAMENVLDALREARLLASSPLTSLLLEATDLLGACVEAAASNQPAPTIEQVVVALDAASPRREGAAVAAPGQELAKGTRTWTVIFRPRPECFAYGINPALVLRELTSLGKAEVDVLLDAIPPFADLQPERCHLGWRVSLVTEASEKQIREVFMFVEDMCDLELSWTEAAASTFTPLPSAPQPSAPQPSAPQPSAPQPSAPRQPHPEPGGEHAPKAGNDASTLRVSTDKVDRLVNLVGELVISQAMISRSMQDFTAAQLPRLREAVEEMERHTRDLQESVMNIRMVPIGSIFGRFRRLVRDLSSSLGKEIQLETVGEDTELDKSMVEHLADPLTHLVRNSADHGLERPEDRVAAGKPPAGRILLAARHQGGNVVVDVSDDGRGLDTARIREKAVERGLVPPDATLSTEQVHELIFLPGFSTAASVTGLSGRGVGMDVVKRSVEGLNGSVTLNSTAGEGSRFRLTLPLTLAILDGMALRVGQATFVLPLNQVVETLSMHKSQAVKQLLSSGEIILVRGETLPLVRLGRLLGVADDGAENRRPLAVVLEVGDVRFGLMVDELLGKSQYVIKNLEPNFQKLDGLLGATILGDGTVSLILDVQALARMGNVRSREERESIMAAAGSRREASA
jgi:two-component system, chemotaxis family, sensor kinase CheA